LHTRPRWKGGRYHPDGKVGGTTPMERWAGYRPVSEVSSKRPSLAMPSTSRSKLTVSMKVTVHFRNEFSPSCGGRLPTRRISSSVCVVIEPSSNRSSNRHRTVIEPSVNVVTPITTATMEIAIPPPSPQPPPSNECNRSVSILARALGTKAEAAEAAKHWLQN
jgi:hypothetical protein